MRHPANLVDGFGDRVESLILRGHLLVEEEGPKLVARFAPENKLAEGAAPADEQQLAGALAAAPFLFRERDGRLERGRFPPLPDWFLAAADRRRARALAAAEREVLFGPQVRVETDGETHRAIVSPLWLEKRPELPGAFGALGAVGAAETPTHVVFVSPAASPLGQLCRRRAQREAAVARSEKWPKRPGWTVLRNARPACNPE